MRGPESPTRRSTTWKHSQNSPQASPTARSVSIRSGTRCAVTRASKKSLIPLPQGSLFVFYYAVTSVPQIDVFKTRMSTSSPRTSGTGTAERDRRIQEFRADIQARIPDPSQMNSARVEKDRMTRDSPRDRVRSNNRRAKNSISSNKHRRHGCLERQYLLLHQLYLLR
ncbi:MAG: hypothetical protein Udaeo2_11690 [Candidatus Udaeobacter sp.]|nr:MAG: hypothetical protein Udaeo2_11690 [Candidatus Udaeobacter sp.]